MTSPFDDVKKGERYSGGEIFWRDFTWAYILFLIFCVMYFVFCVGHLFGILLWTCICGHVLFILCCCLCMNMCYLLFMT